MPRRAHAVTCAPSPAGERHYINRFIETELMSGAPVELPEYMWGECGPPPPPAPPQPPPPPSPPPPSPPPPPPPICAELVVADFEAGMTPWAINGCAGFGCPTVLTAAQVQSYSPGYTGGGALRLQGDWNNLLLPRCYTTSDTTLSFSFDLVVKGNLKHINVYNAVSNDPSQFASFMWNWNSFTLGRQKGGGTLPTRATYLDDECACPATVADGDALMLEFTPNTGVVVAYVNGVEVCRAEPVSPTMAVVAQTWTDVCFFSSNLGPQIPGCISTCTRANAIIDNLQFRTTGACPSCLLLAGGSPCRRVRCCQGWSGAIASFAAYVTAA